MQTEEPTILDENPSSPKTYRVTPFLVIGLILTLISVLVFMLGVFNELIGAGNKGTMTVIVIAVLTFGLTQMVLFFERSIVTEKNKKQVVVVEMIIILLVLLKLYSLGYSY